MFKTGFLCLHGAVGEQELWTAEGEGKWVSVMLGWICDCRWLIREGGIGRDGVREEQKQVINRSHHELVSPQRPIFRAVLKHW